MVTDYRKLWERTIGPIPRDEDGFSYEIHHRDGDRGNNDLENLQLVTIKEHLQIHLDQGDWFAAALIANRIGLGPAYASSMQAGKKRPGVGGVKKGTVPWNKGIRGCYSEATIAKLKQTRAGKRYGQLKISDETCTMLLALFNSSGEIEGEGRKAANGRILTRERLFAKQHHKTYGVTETQLYNIITGKRNVCSQ